MDKWEVRKRRTSGYKYSDIYNKDNKQITRDAWTPDAKQIVHEHNTYNDLVEALEDAILLPNLSRKAEWEIIHSDDLRSDNGYANADKLNFEIAEITEKIRDALKKARGEK